MPPCIRPDATEHVLQRCPINKIQEKLCGLSALTTLYDCKQDLEKTSFISRDALIVSPANAKSKKKSNKQEKQKQRLKFFTLKGKTKVSNAKMCTATSKDSCVIWLPLESFYTDQLHVTRQISHQSMMIYQLTVANPPRRKHTRPSNS